MTGRRKALIVAIDEYENVGLRRLLSPAADAEALAAVLANPQIGDFDVQVVRNEPAYEVQGRIEDLFAEARADDVLLVHFSGHGLKGEAGDLFFAARNTRPDRLASTAVPAEFVQRCVRSTASRSVVLLLDCCYGGAFSQGVAVRAAGDVNVLDSFPAGRLGGGRGRAVITASSAMEYAFEGERLADDSRPEPSLFTAALVQGLSTGEADRDEDGWVSLNELYDYVFDRVRERNANQTPSRDIEMQGELYLARSGRRRLQPAPVPADLGAAMADANPYTRLGAVAELRARLLSDNLSVAAGAFEALSAMAATDTRLVAEAATEALREVTLRLSTTQLDFGRVAQDAVSPPRRLEVTGPPLARSAGVRVSDPWIRLADVAGGYEVTVVPRGRGPLTGTVTISGPGGEAAVTVSVEGVAPEAVPPTSAAPAPVAPAPIAAPTAGAATRTDGADHADAAIRSPDATTPAAPASATVPSPSGGGRRPRREPTPPASPVGDEPPDDARRRRLSLIGWLSVLGAVAILVAVLADTASENPVPVAYALHPAALLIGGLLLVRRSARTELGLGLVLAAATATTVPAVLIFTALASFGVAEAGGPVLVLVLGVCLVVIIVGARALTEVRRSPDLRLALRPVAGPAAWILVGLAVAGGVALALNAFRYTVHAAGGTASWLGWPAFWFVVPAVLVPWAAAGAVPARFRLGLLAGWVLSASGVLALVFDAMVREDVQWRYIPVVAYAVTLPLLLAAALALRGTPRDATSAPMATPPPGPAQPGDHDGASRR
jgi:hypothetical protein